MLREGSVCAHDWLMLFCFEKHVQYPSLFLIMRYIFQTYCEGHPPPLSPLSPRRHRSTCFAAFCCDISTVQVGSAELRSLQRACLLGSNSRHTGTVQYIHWILTVLLTAGVSGFKLLLNSLQRSRFVCHSSWRNANISSTLRKKSEWFNYTIYYFHFRHGIVSVFGSFAQRIGTRGQVHCCGLLTSIYLTPTFSAKRLASFPLSLRSP